MCQEIIRGDIVYNPISISERTKKVRETYLRECPVPNETNPYQDKKYKRYRSGDRWMTLGYLRGWLKYKNAETTRLRTSYAEAEELYQSQPVIYDDELLVGHLYLPDLTEEEQKEYDKLSEMFEMSSHTFLMRPPRKDHIALDYDKLIRKGINGIKKEIEECLENLNVNDACAYPDYETIKQKEFYDCLIIELDAVLELAERYSKKAKEMAESSIEPRKSELLKISEIMEKVPKNPAESFYEAIQSVQFYLSGLFGLYALGRPDRYLYKLYKKDIEEGNITKEFAQELIDNFCLYVSDRVLSRSACGFIVGGQDGYGNLVENDLTYMFLTALDHIKLPDPNGALAVNKKTSNEILTYAAEILSRGTTHPAFYNDDAIINSLVEHYGVLRKDAVEYIHATCAEMSIAGKSKSHSTPFQLDMPKLVYETAKENPDCNDLEEFLDIYVQKLKALTKRYSLQYVLRMLEGSRIGNEAMRACALIDDCIKRGKSIYEGGERYTFIQPIFIGFSTAVDSLYALLKLVFEEKQLKPSEFCEITENNFENHEDLRQYIINKLPHYGNDAEETDVLAKKVSEKILSVFKGNDIAGGKLMMPGTFSYVNHATYGEKMIATFDGRLKGYSYSDGCSPVQSRDINGPTAMVKSLTSWDQSEFLGGMVVNIKFGKNNLNGDGINNFIAILKTFMARGGIEMQVNVVDRKTLIEAKENPESHPDLFVRIGGYSEYFSRLTPTLQQEVIDRTEY